MVPDWTKAVDLPGRLAWVREAKLELDGPRAMARWWEDVPEAERPPGTDHTSVGRYEKGRREPTWAYIKTLGARAGVSPYWILDGVGTPEGLPPGPDYEDGVLDVLRIFVDAWQRAGSLVPGEGWAARAEAIGVILGGKVDPADVIELATVGEDERERLWELYRRAQELGELPKPGPDPAPDEARPGI